MLNSNFLISQRFVWVSFSHQPRTPVTVCLSSKSRELCSSLKIQMISEAVSEKLSLLLSLARFGGCGSCSETIYSAVYLQLNLVAGICDFGELKLKVRRPSESGNLYHLWSHNPLTVPGIIFHVELCEKLSPESATPSSNGTVDRSFSFVDLKSKRILILSLHRFQWSSFWLVSSTNFSARDDCSTFLPFLL